MTTGAEKLQGQELVRRRWNATLELILTDNSNGQQLRRAVTQAEVWDDENYLKANVEAMRQSLQDVIDERIIPGVGLREVKHGS